MAAVGKICSGEKRKEKASKFLQWGIKGGECGIFTVCGLAQNAAYFESTPLS